MYPLYYIRKVEACNEGDSTGERVLRGGGQGQNPS